MHSQETNRLIRINIQDRLVDRHHSDPILTNLDFLTTVTVITESYTNLE
jgi:hypothetical protein